MSVYVDTSAILTISDRLEKNNPVATEVWRQFLDSKERLVVNNYVLLETFALLQNRLGLQSVTAFQQDVVPLLQIDWLDEVGHAASVEALLIANRRQLSLVDCASFHTMRRFGIETAFTFDRHFAEQGFRCLPPVSTQG